MTAPAPVIHVEGLSKSFQGKLAVDHVSLEIDQGDIFGFLGPNGSGKTTTIRLLCGLLTPDEGTGTCLGHDLLREAYQIKRQVGYMTQRFSFYEDLTIRENLDFVARIYGMTQRQDVVDAAIDRLNLTDRQHQLAGTLSGGWKQRLALTACTLHQPRLLLLDEPTAGVDPQARRDFWDQIHHLAADGITVLVSTHYMDEAERCSRLGYIASGRLLADGTPQSLVAESELSTWAIDGTDIHRLGDTLKSVPAAQQIVPFGTRLYVSGTDTAALKSTMDAIARKPGFQVHPVSPRLEDIFTRLMQRQEDTQ
ncbi:ABC transporter ATP-binding protein [Marinobacter caseinilyticus]|uniref:ABC transporter ATP-binding protein n=1 Tax=Marinobacter caseinilyticus TaxID=2692195 RepID=UPI00140CD388|nr:ABC transporter ATP-binding protein [Marinobacter caseinilyticus]